MSEELLQVIPTQLGKFSYYPTRGSNLAQLKKANIISPTVEKRLKAKRPDGIILFPGGAVKAVLEYKQPSELNTKTKIEKAIIQELEVARQLCKLLIVTDNKKTFWVNAITGNRVIGTDGEEVSLLVNVKRFQDGTLTKEEISTFERYLELADDSLSSTQDTLVPTTLLNPTPLAKSLWQKIWISTGKEPEKCLYNVVELFVFKFLSDLGVLKSHHTFDAIYKLRQSSATDALEQYAASARKQIRELFPAGEDKTTIINGTIFVNEKGAANLAQASLFGEVLDLLEIYGKEAGSFKYIQRDFKTRLYESFLRQSAGIKALGQYFTPRNVVQAMVRMSSAGNLGPSARICDPFCGVGGFLLETIAEFPTIYRQFEPKNGKISPSVTLVGYDKGSDEKDDERTIILAKANMLIYFSELVAAHHSPSVLKELSQNAFNQVFQLIRSNLGTFERTNEEPFDLILTNPPYVTSGVSSLKRAIDAEGLAHYYSSGGRGTEALAIEWIVRNLAEGGQALIVVPDGLLTQGAILTFIKQECVVEAIIPLPIRTFYSTAKKTYILILRKKAQPPTKQATPVFCYFVSEIGETRDFYRFPIEKNDLHRATNLFNQFKGSPASFQPNDERCKVINASDFLPSRHWLVDRLWTEEERKNFGADDSISELSEIEFISLVTDTQKFIEEANADSNSEDLPNPPTIEVTLGEDWIKYITTKTGWTKAEYRQLDIDSPAAIPVYSAARHPVARVLPKYPGLIVATKEKPLVSFASNGDGSAGTNFILHTSNFYISNDRTCVRIENVDVDPQYLIFALQGMKEAYGFDHSYKATRSNLLDVTFSLPTLPDGSFDLKAQKRIVQRINRLYKLKAGLEEKLAVLSKTRIAIAS